MALTTQKFMTRNKIVNALPPIDCNGGKTTDIVNLKNYNRCTFILTFGVVNASATPGTLTINRQTDVSASDTEAMAFTYRVEATAAGDTLDAVAAATSSGVDLDAVLSTTNSTTMIVEINADELTDGETTAFNCLSMTIGMSAHSAIGSVVAVLSEPRIATDTLPAAITD